MKYCLKYTNKCNKLNHADEISIKYIEDKGLVDFMEKFKAQRIILRIKSSFFAESEIRKLIAIKKQYPNYNFSVALTELDATLMKKFRKENIAFFMATPCLTWEMFHYLIQQGVSDINISGPLAFELSKVKRVLETLNRKVLIRATVNKVENISAFTNTLIGFFIRPEDVFLYEDYIDIIEFEGIEHQDTFFTIYAEQKQFLGNLNQCIYGFQEQVDNKGLVSLFGERRRDCGRQCLSGGRCRRCYDLVAIAKPMGERARDKILETIRKNIEELKDGKDLSN